MREARSLGNPMMDGLDVAPLPLRHGGLGVVLLPGSRGYAGDALRIMLDALTRLAPVVAVLPWPGDAPPDVPPGWRTDEGRLGSPAWHKGGAVVHVVAGRFEEALGWAGAAIGTSGTAHEQAAGRGVPVIAFPCGPSYRPSFLARQRRLLGDAVEVVAADGGAVADAVRALIARPAERERRAQAGRDRMGRAGGGRRIAADLLSDAAWTLDRAADAPDGPARVASGSGDAS